MSFLTLQSLSPAAQAAAVAAAVAAVGALVAMYFLKLKRIEREVSSTFLWKRSIQDLRANSPFQRLRRNLLLFLQLAILIAALLALGRPAIMSTLEGGTTYILLVDNSASMSSTDVAPSRLSAAGARARDIIDSMTRNDSMMVLTFGSAPKVVATLTDDQDALTSAVRSIETSDTATDVREPLELADSLARSLPNPKIVVISDGAFGGTSAVENIGSPVEFVSVGSGSNNIGITAMELRRSIEDPRAGEIFARITNFSGVSVRTSVTLNVDGQLADAGEISVEPGASTASVFRVRLDSERTAELVLGTDDDLAADNHAFAVLEPPSEIKVTIVGHANPFLLRALSAGANSRVTQSLSPPAEAAAGNGATPVYVYDGEAPASLDRGGYLIFNAVAPATGFAENGTVSNPIVVDVDTSHPVTAFLDLGDIFIDKARRMTFPGETKVLVNGDESPLVALSYVGAARVITVAFDPLDSRWPLRISYPMFISNAVNFLASGGHAVSERQFAAGGVLVIETDPTVGEITVTGPAGDKTAMASQGEGTAAFGKTSRVGIYTVELGGRTLRYAANLNNTAESDIRPSRQFDAGGTMVTAADDLADKNREYWRELLILAFVVLMAEWYIYNRRMYI